MFDKSNEIGAAWLLVEPLLATKKRGDDVTREEVKTAAQGFDPHRLDGRVRQFFLRQGIDPIPVLNVGWHLPTDEEQVRDRAEHHRGRAKRSTKRVLLAAGAVDDAGLAPETRRLRDLYVRTSSAQIAADKSTEGERKLILGAPPAMPRLAVKP